MQALQNNAGAFAGKTYRHSTAVAACVIAILAFAGFAGAAEVRLHDVYSQTGSYSVANLGAGNVIGGETTLGTFDAPRTGVAKAYLYWLGSNQPHDNYATDDTITFNAVPTNPRLRNLVGVPVTADTTMTVEFEKPLTPGSYYWNANHRAFVADVTQLIQPGDFTYSISDFDMDAEFGVGLQIVYEDDQSGADVTIYQGHDFAFRNWADAGELNRTYVLHHTFEPVDFDRELTATFFVGGAADDDRTDQLWFETGAVQDKALLPEELTFGNPNSLVINTHPLDGTDGNEWDTVVATVMIPAGSNFAAFQFESGGGTGTNPLPESFSWLSASMKMTQVPEPSALALLGLGAVTMLRRRR